MKTWRKENFRLINKLTISLLTHVVLEGKVINSLWVLLIIVLLGSNPTAYEVIANSMGQRLIKYVTVPFSVITTDNYNL